MGVKNFGSKMPLKENQLETDATTTSRSMDQIFDLFQTTDIRNTLDNNKLLTAENPS